MTRTETIAFPILIIFILAAACMQVGAAYAGDKSWLLLAAKMWLQGRVLYIDVVEVNPPLIVWLYALPVWLSLHTSFFTDYNLLGILGLLAVAIVIRMSVKLLRLHPQFKDSKRRQMEFFLLAAGLFVFMTSPLYFFDREHMLLVLTFLYMLRFMPSLARRSVSLPMRLLIGLLAALGFCIKPYTLIIFAALQLLYVLRERSFAIAWSVENCVIYALSLAYLACVWHFAPEYIRVILPMALATYSAFSRRLIGMLYALLAAFIAGVAFIDFRLRDRTPYRADIYYFIGVSAAYFAYALVNNGWGYTYHPLICMLLFLTGWIIWDYRWLLEAYPASPARPRWIFGQRACLLSLLANAGYSAYVIAVFFTTPACDWSPDCSRNRPYVAYIREHAIHSFGALSEDFHKWASLARLTGASLDTRYNALWMVPQLVMKGRDFTLQHHGIVEYVGKGLAEDLNLRRPEIVFVDDSNHFFGTSMTVFLPDVFASVPEFKAAWSHYRYGETMDSCKPGPGEARRAAGCKYDIYRRLPPESTP